MAADLAPSEEGLRVLKQGSILIWSSYMYQGTIFESYSFKSLQKPRKTQGKVEEIRRNLSAACQALKAKNMIPVAELDKYRNADLPVRLVASDRFKLIGCKVTKVGSTNMARLLYALDHLSKTNDTNEVSKAKAKKRTIDTMSNKNLNRLRTHLRTYTTFMFVRDPLERLLSAYRDERPAAWFKKVITFSDFLEKVIQIPNKALNKHLQTFTYRCKPCTTKYDFIVNLNNFDEDINKVLKKVGAKDTVILPQRSQTGYKEEKSSNVVRHYSRNVSRDILEQIYEKYYTDYYLFGFARPF